MLLTLIKYRDFGLGFLLYGGCLVAVSLFSGPRALGQLVFLAVPWAEGQKGSI